ncbi:hypothetical protein ABIC83_002475 [Roseateles asaccharophilus]|uniref:hypothetical protein n=1 Tax=Roseateles asaccharophilus TaxID=582607 RepID=UPI003836107C
MISPRTRWARYQHPAAFVALEGHIAEIQLAIAQYTPKNQRQQDQLQRAREECEAVAASIGDLHRLAKASRLPRQFGEEVSLAMARSLNRADAILFELNFTPAPPRPSLPTAGETFAPPWERPRQLLKPA